MRTTKGLIIGLAAGVLALSAISCSKGDDTLRYNNITMGNVVDGTFISDQGNVFNIVEPTIVSGLDTMKRAFTICDILSKTAGAENSYDVRLNYLANVVTKNAIPSSEIAGKPSPVNDPLIIQDIWISGGYVNIYIIAPVKKLDGKKHEIIFVHDEANSGNGTYKFQVYHNAYGDVLKDNDENKDLVLASGYASFPVSSIIKEDNATVKLEWNSYVVLNQSLISAKTETCRAEKKYDKSEFQQAPSTAGNFAAEAALYVE